MNKLAILTLVLFLWTLSCREKTIEPDPPPPPPSLLASPPDTTALELGIDAIPEWDVIQLDWKTRPEYEGYALYRRSQSEENFEQLRTFGISDSNFVDGKNILLNTRYFYYLRARDEDNIWSPPSDTLDYMLIAKAFDLSVSFQPVLVFHWRIQDFSPRIYFLKLFDDRTDEMIWASTITPNYETEEQAVFNWDLKAKDGQILSGGSYRWRVDKGGAETNSGSESNWNRFVMP